MGNTTAALGVGPAGRSSGGGVVGLLVAVGAGDDDLEAVTGLTSVGGGSAVNARSPESALVVGDGRRVLARALVGVDRGVTLNVDVDTSAKIGLVAVSSALGNVVGGESVQAEVAVGVDRGTKVLEGLGVSAGSRSIRGHGMERSVGLEGAGGVRLDLRSAASGLRGARVLRVDESAVGADFKGSSAASRGGEREGVGPADGGAAGGDGDGRSGRRNHGSGRSGGDNSLGGGRGSARRGSGSLGRGSGGRSSPAPPEEAVSALLKAASLKSLKVAGNDRGGGTGRSDTSNSNGSRRRGGYSVVDAGLVGGSGGRAYKRGGGSSHDGIKVDGLNSGRSRAKTRKGNESERVAHFKNIAKNLWEARNTKE